MSEHEEIWLPLVDEPIGSIVAQIQADDPEIERSKPAPDIFLLAAARLGVRPARCVVLEDSLNGARGARAAGMTVIAVPNSAYTADDFSGIAHRVVPSLTRLTLDDLQPIT